MIKLCPAAGAAAAAVAPPPTPNPQAIRQAIQQNGQVEPRDHDYAAYTIFLEDGTAVEDPTDSGALPGHPAWGAPAHWLFDRNGYRVLPPDYTILYDGAGNPRFADGQHDTIDVGFGPETPAAGTLLFAYEEPFSCG